MIAVTDHAEGCVLPFRAQPGARRAGVLDERGEALRMAVTPPAEGGRANKALAETLAGVLGLKQSQIALIGGQTSRDKRFQIHGVPRAELERRVAALAE